MKKVLLVAAFTVAGFIGANAQKDFKLGAGINVGLPVGDLKTLSNFAVGAELQGELGFNETVKGLGTIGYTHFIGKDFGGVKPKFGFVPILVGARFYASQQFFFSGQVGYGFATGDLDGGGFAYKPQVGYDAGKLQVAFSYNAISDEGTLGWLGLSGIVKF